MIAGTAAQLTVDMECFVSMTAETDNRIVAHLGFILK